MRVITWSSADRWAGRVEYIGEEGGPIIDLSALEAGDKDRALIDIARAVQDSWVK